MMEDNTANIIVIVTYVMLLASLVMAFIRLMKGPSVNDRIAAMDLIAIIVMAFILVYSVLVNNSLYFDIPIIISLISFIGTVAVSTYLKHHYD